MNKKKVLVTGGLGFIGSNLVEELKKESLVVVVDDLSSARRDCQELIEKNYLYEKSLEFTDFLDTRVKSRTNEEQVRFIRYLIRDGVDIEETSRVQYGSIHKVKGMTFDNVIVDLTATRREDYFTQLRLKYVAYSRGRVDCWTITSQKQYTLGVRQ